MKTKHLFIVSVVILLMLSACTAMAANSQEARSVDQQQQQYVNGQPVPQFTWSLERHEMIEIYKARNAAVSTYSVVYNQYKGIIQFECPSYGYPIPGGTELTAPEAVPPQYSGVVLPQAEPNGLYSPATSAGTYIMCRADDGTAYPVYEEDNVQTFPYMMTTDETGRLVKANASDQSPIKIDVKQPAGSTTTTTTKP